MVPQTVAVCKITKDRILFYHRWLYDLGQVAYHQTDMKIHEAVHHTDTKITKMKANYLLKPQEGSSDIG